MGNVDACSKDDELVRMFEENNGPMNETAWQFFSRSYTKFCNSIVQPRRWQYESSQLIPKPYTTESFPWSVTEFKVFSQDNTLHCCFWNYRDDQVGMSGTTASSSARPSVSPQAPRLCILYLHTNQRSLYDVHEILPIAKRLRASILSFDLPGCGKSEGMLHGSMDGDVEHLLEWAQCLVGAEVRIILWARGMSTALAISLAQRLCKQKKSDQPYSHDIACMVLDSPYTAIEDMVKAAIDKLHNKGYTLTKSLLKLFIKRTITKLSSQLNGLNVFEIKPVRQVKDITIPAFFLTANADDYIPSDHSITISKKWGGPVQYSMFDGRHYSERDEDVIMRPFDFVYFHAVSSRAGKTNMTTLFGSNTSTLLKTHQESTCLIQENGLRDIMDSNVEDINEQEEETEEELLAIIAGKIDPAANGIHPDDHIPL